MANKRDSKGFLRNILGQLIGMHEIQGENATGTAVNALKINDQGAALTSLTGSQVKQAKILNGQNISESINLEGRTLTAIDVPTGYVSGNITIMASQAENGTYKDLYDSFGSIVTVTVADGRIIGLSGSHLQAVACVQFIKLKSASNVIADRAFNLIVKG